MFGFQQVDFSILNQDDIDNLGVERKRLVLDFDKLVALVANSDMKPKEEIDLLKDRLLELYDPVKMRWFHNAEPALRINVCGVNLDCA